MQQTAKLRKELAALQDALHDAQHHYAGLVARCQHLDLQSSTVKASATPKLNLAAIEIQPDAGIKLVFLTLQKLDQAQAHNCAEVERKTYRVQKEMEHNR